MATYRYTNTRRRLNFARITGAVAILGVVIAGAFFGRMQMIDKKIDTNTQKIETLTEQNKKVEEDIVTMQEEIKGLENQATSLEELIWRYEPVVIPESMK